MARPSNTEERRRQITEGLVKVMALRGYERASVAEIAKAAGLTSGLVHYHFHSKQEILVELVHHLAGGLESRIDRRIAHAPPSPRARLDAFIDAHLSLEDADPKAVAAWVALSAEAIRQPEVREVYGRVVERDLGRLEALVRAVLVDAHGTSAGARASAVALFAAIQGYFVLAAAAPSLTPPGSAAASLKGLAAGLGVAPASRSNARAR